MKDHIQEQWQLPRRHIHKNKISNQSKREEMGPQIIRDKSKVQRMAVGIKV